MKHSEIKVFNTRRKYTVHGQRIAWTVVEHEHKLLVVFADGDRYIDGCFTVALLLPDQDYVMSRYDHCDYDHIPYNKELWELKERLYRIARGEEEAK
jgi:hypothetical protein